MVGLIILGIALLLILIIVLKTVLLKPTSAKTAVIELDESPRAEEYGKRFSEMLKVETISFRGQEEREKFYKFHKTLEELFPNVHRVCEKNDISGSLIFKWKGKGKGDPIFLMSHQDVVEANGQWEHEPFSGDIDEKGRVWGRGAVDTKASLFSFLSAAEELIAEGFVPECDVYLGGSCTEEWSGPGAPAMQEFFKDRNIKLRFMLDEGGMIVEEPVGGVKGIYAMIGIVEKGYGDVKFVARSGGGHASAPKKNTPLVRLGKFMAETDKKSPFKSYYSPVMAEMFKRITPNMTFPMKLIFANTWIFKPLILKLMPAVSSAAGAMLRTTLAFTMASGSDGANVLPQEASVVGNMRFSHHQDDKVSLDIIEKAAKKYDIEVEPIHVLAPCPIMDYKDKDFKLIESITNKIYPGVGTSPYIMTGGTDSRYFSEVCDKCIRFAPIYIDKQQYASIHGLNENIYSGALPMAVDFYKEVVKSL